jgi:hypothetical protein
VWCCSRPASGWRSSQGSWRAHATCLRGEPAYSCEAFRLCGDSKVCGHNHSCKCSSSSSGRQSPGQDVTVCLQSECANHQ